MSECNEVLAEIRKNIKGKTLLVGRKIAQEKFDMLGAALRVEAKPQKYPPGGNVIAWQTELLRKFPTGTFDSVILHRFLYKPVKEYVEDPEVILAEVSRILPGGGVLVVNSFLLDNTTRSFTSADSFFTETEMKSLLDKQNFMSASRISILDACVYVCHR
jgi:SAM-dependent methyltransferase